MGKREERKEIIRKLTRLLSGFCELFVDEIDKWVGGNVLYHFGQVLVLIEDKKRYTEYKLIQHPSLPEKKLIKWKALKPKRGLRKPAKNSTLDSWF